MSHDKWNMAYLPNIDTLHMHRILQCLSTHNPTLSSYSSTRLDEDGKVLTPEELLYRSVQSVNLTHDSAHAQMDVKLRSLICLGLK